MCWILIAHTIPFYLVEQFNRLHFIWGNCSVKLYFIGRNCSTKQQFIGRNYSSYSFSLKPVSLIHIRLKPYIRYCFYISLKACIFFFLFTPFRCPLIFVQSTVYPSKRFYRQTYLKSGRKYSDEVLINHNENKV